MMQTKMKLYGDLCDGNSWQLLHHHDLENKLRLRAGKLKRTHFENGNVRFVITNSDLIVKSVGRLQGARLYWDEINDKVGLLAGFENTELPKLKRCCSSFTVDISTSEYGYFVASCSNPSCPAIASCAQLTPLKAFWEEILSFEVVL